MRNYGTYTIVFFEQPRKADPRSLKVGERFGHIVAEAYLGMDSRRRCVYRFRCDCGRTFEALGSDIRRGRKTSCGFCEFGKKQKVKETKPKVRNPLPEESEKDETICWRCKHSHGKKAHQCSWAWKLTPIEGWTVEEVILKGHKNEPDFTSYKIKECPFYAKEDRKEHAVKSIEYSDKAVERLLTAVIKMAVDDYKKALKRVKRAYLNGETLTWLESDSIWDLYDFFYKDSPSLNTIYLPKVGHLAERSVRMPEYLSSHGFNSVDELILEVDYKGEK